MKQLKTQAIDIPSDREFLHPTISPTESTNLLDNIPWQYSKSAVISCASAALFLDMISYSIIIPILPEYITEVYHLSPDFLGILFGSYAFGLLISTPIFGFLSDYYQNRKIFMMIGYLGLILSSLFFMWGSTFTHLLIARFLGGVSGASSWSMGLSLMGEIATDDLGSLLGSVLAWNFIGFTVGPLLGGVLYEFLGYESVFIVIVILSCIALVHRAIINESYLIQIKREWLMSQQDNDNHSLDNVDSFASLLTKPNIQLGLTLTVFNGSIISGLEPILPLYLSNQFNLNPSHIGLMFICLALPNILFSSWFGNLADKHGNLKMMILGMLASSLGNILVGISTQLGFEIVALLLLGTANCMSLTPVVALIGSGTHAHGKVYALFNACWALGMFIGPSIGTFIYASHGFTSVMCAFASIVIFNTILSAIYYKATL